MIRHILIPTILAVFISVGLFHYPRETTLVSLGILMGATGAAYHLGVFTRRERPIVVLIICLVVVAYIIHVAR